MLAQTIFVREMLSLFTGTEFVIGALLAGWLCWVGAGGILGGRLIGRHAAAGYGAFRRLAVVIALLVPATTVAIRIGRGSLVQPPGAVPPLLGALVFSLLVMAPFGFLFGTLYNVASALSAPRGEGMSIGVSRVYIREAVGSVVAGLLFAFILVPRFSQFEAACITAVAVIAAATLSSDGGGFPIRRAAAVFCLGIVLVPCAPLIDRLSIEVVYPGYRIERFLSSRYGEIVVTAREETVSFFSCGSRLFSVPEPERAEESAHIPLLAHPSPRRVLLIGGSLGGGWEEAAKHPSVEAIDCIELDGALITLALEIDSLRASGRSGSIERAAVDGSASPVVRFLTGDGRFFLAANDRPYDVIILNAPPPLTMQWNRYFTAEFFALARRNLAPRGLFACSHPSSENFITHDQARVLESVRTTMRAAFGDLAVLPGSTVHYIGGLREIDPGELVARLEDRGITTRYVSEGFLPYRFSPDRLAYLDSALGDARDAAVNTDVRPVLPLYELILEGRKMGLAGVAAFESLLGVPFFLPPLVILGVFVICFVRAGRHGAPRLGIMTVGVGSFLFQIMVLLGYQAYSGHLYYAIVLMTALFMGGASAGAYLSLRRSEARRRALSLVHAGFVVLAVSFAAVSLAGSRMDLAPSAGTLVYYLYSAVSGFLTGTFYAIVVRRAFPVERGSAPAVFYAWDLFGAALGGLLGGVLFFPVTGVVGTALFIAALHIFAATVLLGKW